MQMKTHPKAASQTTHCQGLSERLRDRKWAPKLACADFTFPLLSHEHALDLIAMLGFDGVDIGLFEGRSHLWPSREFDNVNRSSQRLGRNLADRGLRAADVFLQTAPDFVPLAINHPQPSRRRKARDWFLKTLDYAADCGSRHVTILPGVFFDEEARSVSWARCCDELAWRVERARTYGVLFGVEAHVGSVASAPRDAARLIRDVPGLTLTLDYTHFTRKGLPDSVVEPLIPLATHFHARGARKGRLQVSFAKNTINYRHILDVMQAAGYQGYVGIEYVWIDWEHCNEVDNLSETVRFRDFFRSQ
jgi:sugar phosphate isomerase/epimerase